MGDRGSKAPSQQKPPIDDKKLREAVYVYQKSLDDLVSVNSLFTVAVFVGLAFASDKQQNIEGNKECEAGVHVARRLVRNEVISFAFYLFSSLVAKSLKTHLFTYLISPITYDEINDTYSKVLRGSLFVLSTSTSIIGGLFLLYSIIDIIQLRLGKVSCKGTQTLHTVGVLIGVNIFALLIYLPFVILAIIKSTVIFKDLHPRNEAPFSKAWGIRSIFGTIFKCKGLIVKLFQYLLKFGKSTKKVLNLLHWYQFSPKPFTIGTNLVHPANFGRPTLTWTSARC
ncbi:hypothetical protein ACJRO7_000019 [Eucalyptus globulus]|uniref:Uncharacterized protein n=1 Tax=Eucalyptus globulus TaxID=34317 RepID=A0ABD3LPK6_EUCGL